MADVTSQGVLSAVAKKRATAAEETYPFFFDFEETGTPSGLTIGGTVDTDQTTGAIFGTESAEISSSTSAANYVEFVVPSGSSAISVKFSVDHSTPSVASDLIRFLNSSDTMQARMNFRTNNTVRNTHGTVNTDTSAINLTSYVTYWVDYTKGTGSNGQLDVYVAEGSTTKPGTPTRSITTGTATDDIAKIRIYGLYGANVLLDNYTVDESTIS